MAKKQRRGTRRSTRGAHHVRLTCPHCGKYVTVQPPRRSQRDVPCPNCRIPIDAELIVAEDVLTAEGGEVADTEEVVEETETMDEEGMDGQ